MAKTFVILCLKVLLIAGIGAHYLSGENHAWGRGRRQNRNGNQFNEENTNESTQNSSENSDEQSGRNDKSIDEIIGDALKKSNDTDSSEEELDSRNSTERIELDILLTAEQQELLYPNGRMKRNAISNVNQRWPDKTLIYKISPGIFTQEETDTILESLAIWREHTCLNIREKTDSDIDYVMIYNGNGGCYSYVGYIRRGGQELGLDEGCAQQSVVVHEVGHAIGLFHEHTRPDRDQFIDVITENVREGAEDQFSIRNPDVVDDHGTKYDYNSIMHYGRTFFSSNGGDTIRTKDPSFQNVIGRTDTVSFLDALMVNSMYNCAEGCPPINCPNGGYQGKDCKCHCSADGGTGIALCSDPPTTTSSTTTSTTTTVPSTTTTSTTKASTSTSTPTTTTTPSTTTASPTTTTTTTTTTPSTTTTSTTSSTTTPTSTTSTTTTTTQPTTTTSTTSSSTTTPTTTTPTTTRTTTPTTTTTPATSTTTTTPSTSTSTSTTSTTPSTTSSSTTTLRTTTSTITSSSSTSTLGPDTPDICEDIWSTTRCRWYKWLGSCESRRYVRRNCQMTCDLCDHGRGLECLDSYPRDICRLISWYGMCGTYSAHCRDTCGVC